MNYSENCHEKSAEVGTGDIPPGVPIPHDVKGWGDRKFLERFRHVVAEIYFFGDFLLTGQTRLGMGGYIGVFGGWLVEG
jgi:hypothetical protein